MRIYKTKGYLREKFKRLYGRLPSKKELAQFTNHDVFIPKAWGNNQGGRFRKVGN